MCNEIRLLLHNVRSTHNVGSIYRTSDGFGVSKIYISGYTPYPTQAKDARLPHISSKLNEQISKVALGAERSVATQLVDSPIECIDDMKCDGWRVVGLEQSDRSVELKSYRSEAKTLLIVGEEVDGIADELLELCDDIVEIPMKGHKESFNVSIATGICLYALSG